MVKKIGIVILFLVLINICFLAKADNPPNIDSLLRNSKNSLSWTNLFSMHIEIDTHHSTNVKYVRSGNKMSMHVTDNMKTDHYIKDHVFRRDKSKKRVEWLSKVIRLDDKGNQVGKYSYLQKRIATGELYLNVSTLFGAKPKSAHVYLNYKELVENILGDPDTGSPLLGGTNGGATIISSLLDAQSDNMNISLDIKPEKINGMFSYKVISDTKHNKITAWISPEKGYNIVKWTLQKKPEHYKGPLKLKSWLEIYEITELPKIEGVFVPTEATYTTRIEDISGLKFITNYKYRVEEIDLNPDFEKLGAFKIDLPNGTPVRIEEAPGIRYKWQDGKLVPDVDEYVIDELDRMIEELMAEGQVPAELATAKKTKAAPNELIATANTQPKTQVDDIKTRPEVVAESGSLPVVLVILIGLLIIGIIVWLVFRRLKA